MPRPKIYEDGLTPQQRYALKHRKLVSVNFYIPSEEDIYTVNGEPGDGMLCIRLNGIIYSDFYFIDINHFFILYLFL